MLLVSWIKDIYHFLIHIYRSDIRSYEVVNKQEFIMTEE